MGFGADVDKALARFKARADEIAQTYVLKAGLYLVVGKTGASFVTPVRTGTLVAGYQIEINGKGAYKTKLPPDPTREFTPAYLTAMSKKVRWGQKVSIVNYTYYGYWVDQGTRHFGGRHMIAKTMVYLRGLKV